MTSALPRAVLDANVIYSRVLHELFGRLAGEGARLSVLWSDELLDEARRAIRDRKPTTNEVARRWVGYLPTAFPANRVDLAERDLAIDLTTLTSDPGDHHICALAIAGNADILITSDAGFGGRSHLAPPLAAHGVSVSTPDALLTTDAQDEPELYLAIAARQAATWIGGRPLAELLDAYERAGAQGLRGPPARATPLMTDASPSRAAASVRGTWGTTASLRRYRRAHNRPKHRRAGACAQQAIPGATSRPLGQRRVAPNVAPPPKIVRPRTDP